MHSWEYLLIKQQYEFQIATKITVKESSGIRSRLEKILKILRTLKHLREFSKLKKKEKKMWSNLRSKCLNHTQKRNSGQNHKKIWIRPCNQIVPLRCAVFLARSVADETAPIKHVTWHHRWIVLSTHWMLESNKGNNSYIS